MFNKSFWRHDLAGGIYDHDSLPRQSAGTQAGGNLRCTVNECWNTVTAV